MVSNGNRATESQPHSAPTAEEIEQNPLKRRFWLLRQALNSGSSFADAVKIAERIEAFLVVGTASCSSNNTPDNAAVPHETARGRPIGISPEAVSSTLAPEKKAALIVRLEAGEPNTRLAAEFGLTPRQVQGLRMQVGRRAKRKLAAVNRQQHGPTSVSSTGSSVMDEVVRYLRQQGDFIVADGPGMFLINRLFRLDVDQLQHRANRMRQRQRKPEFQIGERPRAVPGAD